MKRKILLLGVFIGILFLVGGCFRQKLEEEDAFKFKKEYENYNGVINPRNGQKMRTLQIASDNPFVYTDGNGVRQMIADRKSFVLYLGFGDCPWCRSVLPSLIEAATDLGIPTIYYIDLKDIRDQLEVDSDGNVHIKKEGSSDYKILLEIFDLVLEDYQLRDRDGNLVDTSRKRIYAPSIISVVKGEVMALTTGISAMQTDGYMELTEEIKQDSYERIVEVIRVVVEDKEICSARAGC